MYRRHRDWRAYKMVRQAARTDVFMALRRVMAAWREDPERLAVAVTAYEMLGYNMAAFEIEYPDRHGHGRTSPDQIWSHDRAIEVVHSALHRRNRRVLRARAYGLLMALDELAVDAEFARLHRVQADSAVIECRVLSIDERIERLRSSGSPAG